MTMFWKISVVVLLTLCVQVFAQNKKLLGGWRDVDENDEYTQDALQYAKKEYNKSSKDGFIIDIVKTIRLRKQVVAGMKYSMEVEAVISQCPEDQMLTEECQNHETKKKRCSFEVLDVPWRKHRELRKGYCSTIRN